MLPYLAGGHGGGLVAVPVVLRHHLRMLRLQVPDASECERYKVSYRYSRPSYRAYTCSFMILLTMTQPISHPHLPYLPHYIIPDKESVIDRRCRPAYRTCTYCTACAGCTSDCRSGTRSAVGAQTPCTRPTHAPVAPEPLTIRRGMA